MRGYAGRLCRNYCEVCMLLSLIFSPLHCIIKALSEVFSRREPDDRVRETIPVM